MRKLYMDRRRTAMETLGYMSEGRGLSVKHLMEEIGLENDDEYGCDHKQFPILR